MASPVLRKIRLAVVPEGLPAAGIEALAERTMLAPDNEPTYAVKRGDVDVLSATDEVLVNPKALVGDVSIMQEEEHATEDASSRLSAHAFVSLLAANERPSVNTMVAVKAKGDQRIAEFLNLFGEVNGLIMKHHADGIVARRTPVWVEASRLVDENTDFLGALVHDYAQFEITKARIASRPRQESFPRAGDSGFRPCQRKLYQIRLEIRKGARIEAWRQRTRFMRAMDAFNVL